MSSKTVKPGRWFLGKLRNAEVVEDGADGLEAGTLQEALQELATRVQALEDAAE